MYGIFAVGAPPLGRAGPVLLGCGWNPGPSGGEDAFGVRRPLRRKDAVNGRDQRGIWLFLLWKVMVAPSPTRIDILRPRHTLSRRSAGLDNEVQPFAPGSGNGLLLSARQVSRKKDACNCSWLIWDPGEGERERPGRRREGGRGAHNH